MRNNEDRFNHSLEDDASAAMSDSSESSLNFVCPTEFVDLPSKGKFYPPMHPLHGAEEIEIKFMTAKEEDILTSQSLLKKGIAIDRMLQNLIVDKRVKLQHMLSGDKNAILIASRISAYGPEYPVSVVCPSCNEKTKFEFDLTNLKIKETAEPEDLGVQVTDHGTFICELPRTRYKVEFRLLNSEDETKIAKILLDKKQDSNTSTLQLRSMLVSINGDSSQKTLSMIVENLPAADARHLRNLLKSLSPDLKMADQFVCPSCENEEEMEVPLTAEFFWPR